MFNYYQLINRYRGKRIYLNANPSIGNDTNPGTQDFPVLTFSEAIDRVRPEGGDLIIASSSLINSPSQGYYAFTENVLLNKSNTAIIGRYTINVNSGIGLQIYESGAVSVYSCLVTGAYIYGTGLSEAIRIKNGSYCIVADSLWLNLDSPNQKGFTLQSIGGTWAYLHGGNGFMDCKALGGNFANTVGFELCDEGQDSNYLLNCGIYKNETGLYISNSAQMGEHAIVNCRFGGNDTPCNQYDALHGWYLYGNYYSDIPKGFDATGKETTWPNGSASWDFAHPDELPIRNIGAIFSDKMQPVTNMSIIRNQLLKNIPLSGFGKVT